MIQIGNNSTRSKDAKSKAHHQKTDRLKDKKWHCKQWLIAFIEENGGGRNKRMEIRKKNYDDDQVHEVQLSWFLAVHLLEKGHVDARIAEQGVERMGHFKSFFKEAVTICARFKFNHHCQLPETNRELSFFIEFFRGPKNATPPPRPVEPEEPARGSADPGLPRAGADDARKRAREDDS